MPNLNEWVEVDFPRVYEGDETPLYRVFVFPRLEYLRVRGCTQLTCAPSHFPCLKKLEIIEMESSLPLENICGMKLTTLTSLYIYGVKGLLCLPDGLLVSNRNLSYLKINGCPNMTHLVPCLQGGGDFLRELNISHCSSLRELPDDLQTLNALEELSIWGCPKLKSIAYPSSIGGGQQYGFISLRELRIQDCEGLTNMPIEMMESCAPSLEELSLDKLSNITNIANVIGYLHRMARLRELGISEIPKFSIKDIGSLRLQHFRIGSFSDSSWNNVSFNETVDAMLLRFISLRELRLFGMEHWDCLPDQLQHLNALTYLDLYYIGIEELPEWFGNLSSFERLHLYSLQKLRHLPSKQAMLRLSKLKFLNIRSCSLLLKEKRRNSDGDDDDSIDEIMVDSECLKISHIPYITVEKTRNY